MLKLYKGKKMYESKELLQKIKQFRKKLKKINSSESVSIKITQIYDECFKNTILEKYKDKLKYIEVCYFKDGKVSLHIHSALMRYIFYEIKKECEVQQLIQQLKIKNENIAPLILKC
jgi:N12 class adenine-specific DNA methylase